MAEQPENAGRKPDGRFAKGNRINPDGKPKGARHRTTLAVEALLDGDADRLTRKAIELAMAGDTVALRLCLERIAAPRRDRPIHIDLPPIGRLEDHPAALAAVMEAVATGELTPSEGEAFAKIVEAYRRAAETAEMERRLAALETQYGTGQ